jgi:hypothetical protein
MPYYVGVNMPEWDEYRRWESRILRGGQPRSLFKYVEPWEAKTTVLSFPATPGPEPQRLGGGAQFLEEDSGLALWEVSTLAETCRDLSVKRVFGSYDGGGDESFTHFQGVEMSDGRVLQAGSSLDDEIDFDQLVEAAVSALMGGFDVGEFSLHGVVIIDVDACTITDEKNADVVLGNKKPWEV